MIIAVLSMIGGISLTLRRPIERKFKNRTLAFISLMYIGACIVIGVSASINASTFSILGGLLLNIINVQNAFLIVGLFALACMVVVLDYMRTRFGLKPEEYKKEDIEFESITK